MHWAEEIVQKVCKQTGRPAHEVRLALFVEAAKIGVALGAMTLDQANAELASRGIPLTIKESF